MSEISDQIGGKKDHRIEIQVSEDLFQKLSASAVIHGSQLSPHIRNLLIRHVYGEFAWLQSSVQERK